MNARWRRRTSIHNASITHNPIASTSVVVHQNWLRAQQNNLYTNSRSLCPNELELHGGCIFYLKSYAATILSLYSVVGFSNYLIVRSNSQQRPSLSESLYSNYAFDVLKVVGYAIAGGQLIYYSIYIVQTLTLL